MEIEISDIVASLNGRDCGRRFFVVGADTEGYVLLADGKHRRIEKPKRKKRKHVRFEAKSALRAAVKLRSGEKVANSELRKALAEHSAAETAERGGR
jgi:ribosomal protein L14E/L6E/L27E